MLCLEIMSPHHPASEGTSEEGDEAKDVAILPGAVSASISFIYTCEEPGQSFFSSAENTVNVTRPLRETRSSKEPRHSRIRRESITTVRL